MQVAGIRSNLWPGAVTVSSGPTVASIYVGWGMKNAPFVPLPPPPVPHEYEDAPLESVELPPKPEPEAPPPPEDADDDGDDA
jgi:radial spoke head protein 4A